MADIVNLRTVRKRLAREQKGKAAEANRLAHGVPADERKSEAARRDKASRDLEGHRRDGGDSQ